MSTHEDQCLLKGQDMCQLHCLMASCRCNGVMAFPPFQHLWGISVTCLLFASSHAALPLLPAVGRCWFRASLPCCAHAAANRFCSISAVRACPVLGWAPAVPCQAKVTSSVPCSCLLWCRLAARTNGQSEFLLLCSCPFSSQNVPHFVYILQYISCVPPTENCLILTFACGFGDLNLGLKIICLMVGFTL